MACAPAAITSDGDGDGDASTPATDREGDAPSTPSVEADGASPSLGDDDGAVDGGRDAADASATPSVATWSRYVIEIGAHAARVEPGPSGPPRAGFVSGVAGRAYDLAFDPSAAYVITKPVQPNDQLDWNKLPGVSDCGTLDLAVDGVMFGWRWRTDLTPSVLEVTAYANNARTHLTAPSPMLVLDAADLASKTALHYALALDGALYRFRIMGSIRGRAVDVETTLTRRCATTSPASLSFQWASGLYFGGTSTAPSKVTAYVFEP